MTFYDTLMNYAVAQQITKKTINNCYTAIIKQDDKFNGFNLLQIRGIQIIIKKYKERVTRENPELVSYFDSLFNDILNFKIAG